MKILPVRGLLLTVALLSAFAIAGAPAAHATFTPPGSIISSQSTNPVFTLDRMDNISCSTSEYTARINGSGTTISGTVIYSGLAPRGTCTESLFRFAVPDIICSYTITSTSSVAGSRATADLRIGLCSISIPAAACTIDINPQVVRGGATFDQASQTLSINAAFTARSRSGRAPCTVRTVTLTASYVTTTINGRPGRLTIS